MADVNLAGPWAVAFSVAAGILHTDADDDPYDEIAAAWNFVEALDALTEENPNRRNRRQKWRQQNFRNIIDRAREDAERSMSNAASARAEVKAGIQETYSEGNRRMRRAAERTRQRKLRNFSESERRNISKDEKKLRSKGTRKALEAAIKRQIRKKILKEVAERIVKRGAGKRPGRPG